jgi:hypothetical protein
MSASNHDFGSLEKHVAGQTVQHVSPFSEIEVPVSYDLGELGKEKSEKWVKPFYLSFFTEDSLKLLRGQIHEVDSALIESLLKQFNWRTRSVGACLVAATKSELFLDWVGKLLLRSDVCYAGKGYCLALAALNSAKSVTYLDSYLRYYLQEPQLCFDQGDALAALIYIDKVNGMTHHESHLESWQTFTADKPNWDLREIVVRFERKISLLEGIRKNSQPK